jgi:hypothetical protein
LEFPSGAIADFRREKAGKRPPDDLGFRVAEEAFRPGVPFPNASIGVEEKDRGVRNAFHEETKSLLAIAGPGIAGGERGSREGGVILRAHRRDPEYAKQGLTGERSNPSMPKR